MIKYFSKLKQRAIHVKNFIVIILASSFLLNLNSRANLENFKDASIYTKQKNAEILNELSFKDQQDFSNATRGFIGTDKNLIIKNNHENYVIWDLTSYNFLTDSTVPSSINPSLWRQARLNMNNGLFKVTDKIYQVRGYDISNIDIIESDNGLIIIDPLMSEETARAAMNLYFRHRPKKPVKAVIYTHSHADHYGGVKGIVDEKDVVLGKVKIYAPENFLHEAVSENIYAGNAMTRRASYQYGPILPRGIKGQVDAGLGKTSSLGNVTLIAPTDEIKQSGEVKNIDGIEIVFQMAPHTEAPAEMIMYFPQFKALCIAEDANHTMHNLYTLRGAQIRNASAWWKTLNEAVELFGDKTEVLFGQHHWPTWGQSHIVEFLESQRDLYKYINDQTLRLLNQGYNMIEISNMLKLPKSLDQKWYNRGYYGSVSHNAKAVYQRYLGWYDSNPAHLDLINPTESSKKYVQYMGGAHAVLKKARASYKEGDYRWVAQVVNHVVFADPSNKQARALQADTLEQLGYQQENPTWRNEYLMGAYELRNGVGKLKSLTVSPDSIRAMTLDMFLDYLGICLDGPKADGKKIILNLQLKDTKQNYVLKLQNSVLSYTPNKYVDSADVSIILNRDVLDKINLKHTTLSQEIEKNNIKVNGDRKKLDDLFSLFVNFKPDFNLVTPN
jgi:alkyl sulfatase BDS1-like metallo-beta-lactamase superfamily hydrolase